MVKPNFQWLQNVFNTAGDENSGSGHLQIQDTVDHMLQQNFRPFFGHMTNDKNYSRLLASCTREAVISRLTTLPGTLPSSLFIVV